VRVPLVMEIQMGSPDNKPKFSASRRTPARGDGREPMQFFTVAQVAEFFEVSTRSVRRWIKSRKLVAHYFGAAVRIAETDLRAFMAVHRDR